MKVLVVSDTHGKISNVEEVLEQVIACGVNTVIHCGDHIEDARRIQELYKEVHVYGVYGNCDGMAYGDEITRIIEIEGVSILVTHGHKYDVKWGDYEDLVIDAQAYDAQVVLFGHSHCAYMNQVEGVWLINPGSMSYPRDTSYPSYAILELNKGKVDKISILQLHRNGVTSLHPVCHPWSCE